MQIKLSDHFTFGRLLRFTLPSIVMMIFTSIYSVVDGFFVSNYVGKTPFAAVNLIMPYLMVLGTFGFMFGTGGSALVGKTLGEGDDELADKLFSLFVYTTMLLGFMITVIGLITLRPVAILLGAEGELLEYCLIYGRVMMFGASGYMLQMAFQSFFVTAERPNLGLFVTLGAGLTNIILDIVLVGLLGFGVTGAAMASIMSEFAGGFTPLIYFRMRHTNSRLHLVSPVMSVSALLKACSNGASELMSNVSMSFVSMMYNIQLIRFAGEMGVAAYGVLMYVSLVFLALFIGYSVGTAPVVSFHYGAGHKDELTSLLKKSLIIIMSFSIFMCVSARLLAGPLSMMFVGYDPEMFALTQRAFYFYAFSFLFCGIAIYGSSFFTALNDGMTSALISFLRTMVFQVAAVIVFPMIWGIDGIWISIIGAEVAAAGVTIFLLIRHKDRYGYWQRGV